MEKDLEAASTSFRHCRGWLRVKEERAKELVRQAISMDTKRSSWEGEITWWCSQRGKIVMIILEMMGI